MPGFALPKITVPETRRWLPAVVLVLCLSMFGMVAVAMLTVGADPESGPSSLPTSTAAQGYQGLKRLLVKRGHPVSSNRFEDSAGEAGGDAQRPRHSDIELITLNYDGMGWSGIRVPNLRPNPRPNPRPKIPRLRRRANRRPRRLRTSNMTSRTSGAPITFFISPWAGSSLLSRRNGRRDRRWANPGGAATRNPIPNTCCAGC